MLSRISIQGMHGSYSEIASKELFRDTELLFCHSFDEAIEMLEQRRVDYSVIPVSNSAIGEITHSNKSVRNPILEKIDEIEVDVDHVLAGTTPITLDHVNHVSSHPAALLQCGEFLASKPHWHITESTDTAGALKDVLIRDDYDHAAICSKYAATIYGAQILAEGISDVRPNKTLFHAFRRKQTHVRRNRN